MDETGLLDGLTVVLAVGALASGLMALWRPGSEESHTSAAHRFTPLRTLMLALTVVALVGGLASQLLEVDIAERDRRQKQLEDAAAAVAKVQEKAWEAATAKMVQEARDTITQNLRATLRQQLLTIKAAQQQQQREEKISRSIAEESLRNAQRANFELDQMNRLRVEQADYSQRALQQIWRAATRVDLSGISVIVRPRCNKGPDDFDYATLLDGTGVVVEIAHPGDRYGDSDRVDILAVDQHRSSALEYDYHVVTYTNFSVEQGGANGSGLGGFRYTDGWRGAKVTFYITGGFQEPKDSFIDRVQGKFYSATPDDPHPGRLTLISCQDFNFQLVIDGVTVAGTVAKPFFDLDMLGLYYHINLQTEADLVDENALPRFPEPALTSAQALSH